MNPVDERLAKEVRKYENLYVTSLKAYKDVPMTSHSWSEIAKAVGLSVPECIRRWRSLRNKFVRLQRKMSNSSGGAGGERKVPKLCVHLSWLLPHVKHRETSSNDDVTEEQNSQGRDNGVSESPVEGPIDDNFPQVLEELKDDMLVIQRQLETPEDAITRFTRTMDDMLRRVPEEDQDDTMLEIYNLLYRHMKRWNTADHY